MDSVKKNTKALLDAVLVVVQRKLSFTVTLSEGRTEA
jgi:hypothetical protein